MGRVEVKDYNDDERVVGEGGGGKGTRCIGTGTYIGTHYVLNLS